MTAALPSPVAGARAPRPSRLVVLTAILALHLLVFGWLGLSSVPPLSAPEDPSPFVIELLPRSAPANADAAPIPTAPVLPPARPLVPFQPRSPALAAPAGRAAPGLALSPAPPQAVIEPAPSAAVFGALRNSALGCRLGRSTSADQDRCDRALAEAAARAAPVRGTGDPGRDARFAAEGAEQLARYEDKRKPLKPYSRAEPCPGSPSPSDDCAFTLQGRIWSSRDGWLPDLPRPH